MCVHVCSCMCSFVYADVCVHVCFLCVHVYMQMCVHMHVRSCVYADAYAHVDAGDLNSGSHGCVAGILHSGP